MVPSRHPLFWIGIALAALWVVLPAPPSVALAGPDGAAGMRRSGCCGPIRIEACCCCPKGSAGAVGPIAPRASRIDTSRSRNTCECRASEPAAPAPRPDGRGAEQRTEKAGAALAVDAVPHDTADFLPRRAMVSSADSPRHPLYLRTSRLLI
ncbi:MAG TPA: hypothetical protein VKP69_15920 [Isosphaeraceae bacterium]|nr:hypothetical protein [Isosphaeraceae bacterium]